MKRNDNLRPIDQFERGLIDKVSGATFPPASNTKRFVRELYQGHKQNLSDRGRWYLAFIAHRFRRQYTLTNEEWAWVNLWRNKELNDQPADKPSECQPGREHASDGGDVQPVVGSDQGAARQPSDRVSLPLFPE